MYAQVFAAQLGKKRVTTPIQYVRQFILNVNNDYGNMFTAEAKMF